MTTKLSLYNGALRLIGESKLADLTEDNKARRTLDDVYDDSLVFCLEQGLWNFAMRAVEIDYDPAIVAEFGYGYGFEVPSDWVRTDAVSLSSNFNPPLTNYVQEQAYWYAAGTPLYVRYVSKDADYGLDLTAWPVTFARYVESHLAAEISPLIPGSRTKQEDLLTIERRRKIDASAKDVLNEAARFKPLGSWVRSRGGSWFSTSSRR